MCQVYKCFEKEWFEDADNAGREALESMRTCAPDLAGFYLGFIEQTASHLMAEIPTDVIHNAQYQEWMNHRAEVFAARAPFRHVLVTEVCPI